MKKILFVAQNLQIGGVQKALVNQLKMMSSGDEVSLFTFGDGPLMAEIPPFVRVIKGRRALRLIATPMQVVLQRKNVLDMAVRALLTFLVRVMGSQRMYRSLLKGYCKEYYDTAISYFTDVPHNYFNQGTNLFVSEFVQAEEKLAWIHNDPIDGKFDPVHCEKVYRGFDRLVCVSQAVKDRFCTFLPQYTQKLVVYHNQFPVEEIRALAGTVSPYPEGTYHIVTTARVDNLQKRVDGIVKLCARLRSEGVEGFCWHIVGDGPDLSGNQQLARELGVEDLICFEGAKTNPFPYIKYADLFALYSAYEGYPMVVGEAQALNTFILTTNYAAAKEQIAPAEGIIAKDDEEFYQELKRLILCRS